MLAPLSTADPDIGSETSKILIQDHELCGELNHALAQGAKFALILAMLEQNYLHRPKLKEETEDSHINQSLVSISHYRSNPLKAREEDWKTFQQTGHLVQSGNLRSAHLWQLMHPEPLSLYNDDMFLSEEVMANCSLPVQERHKNKLGNQVEIDETKLYEILQDLPQQDSYVA